MENPIIATVDDLVKRLRECSAHARAENDPNISVTEPYISLRAPSGHEIHGIDQSVKELFHQLHGRIPNEAEWRDWYQEENIRDSVYRANPHLERTPTTTLQAWENMLEHFLGTRVFLSKLLHEQAHRRELEAARTPSNHYKEIIMGDVFKNISNSSIINRSSFFDALSSLEAKSEPDLMAALESIAGEVEASGNKAAGELLEQLMEELSREEPRRSLIKRSWEGLVDLLPSVAKIATATAALGKLLS